MISRHVYVDVAQVEIARPSIKAYMCHWTLPCQIWILHCLEAAESNPAGAAQTLSAVKPRKQWCQQPHFPIDGLLPLYSP